MSAVVGASTTELAPAFRPTPAIRLGDAVPADPWFAVRLTLISAYGVAYVWWFLTHGLIIDRISVAISLFIFLVCAFIGKPWQRWAWLGVEVVLYVLMWSAYESTRGNADGVHHWFGFDVKFPLQVSAWRNVDRFVFFGHDPNVVLARHFYDEHHIRWYDNVASVTYFTHFVFPVIAMAALWAGSQVQWRRFMKRFATLLVVACAMFVVLPSAPPWMASGHPYDLIPHLPGHTGAGFFDLGFKNFIHSFNAAREWGNAIAAMPSLHSSFALIVPAFFLPWLRWTWLKIVVLLFPVLMLTSLVYFGEHWVIDGLVGWAIVGGTFLFWNKVEARGRAGRAARARAALDGIHALAA